MTSRQHYEFYLTKPKDGAREASLRCKTAHALNATLTNEICDARISNQTS
jgi:hypothetical protein